MPSQGHRGLLQGYRLNQRNNVAADTDCIIVLSLQTTFHIFSLLVDGALRLHVSARHTDTVRHTHTQLYTHTHAPYNRELTY